MTPQSIPPLIMTCSTSLSPRECKLNFFSGNIYFYFCSHAKKFLHHNFYSVPVSVAEIAKRAYKFNSDFISLGKSLYETIIKKTKQNKNHIIIDVWCETMRVLRFELFTTAKVERKARIGRHQCVTWIYSVWSCYTVNSGDLSVILTFMWNFCSVQKLQIKMVKIHL